MQESINYAIKEDSEISSQLITNLEILLEKNMDELIKTLKIFRLMG